MDENTWRIMETFMWIIGIQTTVIVSVIAGIWFSISNSINEIKLSLDKLNDKVNDIDKRVVAIETILHLKDCCVLKDEKINKKAE